MSYVFGWMSQRTCVLSCSQEVGHDGLIVHGPGSLVSQGVEGLKGVFKLFIDFEHRGNIAASVAVVGCGPNGNEVAVSEPILVALHDELMCSCHKVNVIDMIEFSSDLGSEEPSGTSGGHCPGLDFFGVRPHKVAERTLVRDLHSSIDESNLVNGLNLG